MIRLIHSPNRDLLAALFAFFDKSVKDAAMSHLIHTAEALVLTLVHPP